MDRGTLLLLPFRVSISHTPSIPRLNKIYREAVNEDEIMAILKPMLKAYALERLEGEHFGDYVIRAGIISATTSGKAFVSFSSRRICHLGRGLFR